MAGKRKKLLKDDGARAMVAFVDRLTEALDHFDKPAWLGQHSPLASPYFSGSYLRDQPATDTAIGRGLALQALIEQGIQRLESLHGQRTDDQPVVAKLLRLSYINRNRSSRELLAQASGLSLASYHRERRRAIQYLAQAILTLVKPSIQIERPPKPPELYEREQAWQQVIAALDKNVAVAIAGPAGVGKTALAASIVRRVPPANTFWHTCAPGQGDNLTSFLFAFGRFLERNGVRDLWLYLASEWKDSDLARVARRGSTCSGIVRACLRKLSNKTLICVDEIDRLHPEAHEAHAQLQSFLELIQPDVQLLLIGGPTGLAEITVPLSELTATGTQQVLACADITLSMPEVDRFMSFTRGNPRLVRLMVTLQGLGERIDSDVFQNSPYISASLDSIFRRIWQRLSPDERVILSILAVSRRAVPRELWSSEAHVKALLRLNDLHLIDINSVGGVTLPPVLRQAAANVLDEDQRERSHSTLASCSSDYGQYTEVAYHYINAGQPSLALQIWQEHKTGQIDQGQAGVANQLFKGIALAHLPASDWDLLHLLRAELSRVTGDYDYAEQELTRANTSADAPMAVSVLRQMGDLRHLRDRDDLAIKSYQAALTIADQRSQALEQVILTRADMALAQSGDDLQFDLAWSQALMARHEVNFVQGLILERRQRFEECLDYYREAIRTAELVRSLEGEAKARANLAAVLARMDASNDRLIEIEANLKRAIEIYERSGRLSQIAAKMNDMAMAFNLAEQPDRARPYALAALEQSRALNWSSMIAAAAQSVAEAELALGHFEAAEKAAVEVINTEETRVMSDGLRVLGEIHLARGQLKPAEQLIQQAIHAALSRQDAYLEAYGWRALGRCYAAANDHPRAIEANTKASTIFSELGLMGEKRKTDEERSKW